MKKLIFFLSISFSFSSFSLVFMEAPEGQLEQTPESIEVIITCPGGGMALFFEGESSLSLGMTADEMKAFLSQRFPFMAQHLGEEQNLCLEFSFEGDNGTHRLSFVYQNEDPIFEREEIQQRVEVQNGRLVLCGELMPLAAPVSVEDDELNFQDFF